MINDLELSTLKKTWFFDFDGTLVLHHSEDIVFIAGVLDFLKKIQDKSDVIIITTSRPNNQRRKIEEAFYSNGVKNFVLLLDLPYGERLLVNDIKPSGLKTAYAINVQRDSGEICSLNISENL